MRAAIVHPVRHLSLGSLVFEMPRGRQGEPKQSQSTSAPAALRLLLALANAAAPQPPCSLQRGLHLPDPTPVSTLARQPPAAAAASFAEALI